MYLLIMITTPKKIFWNKKDDEIIKKYYGNSPSSFILNLLPGINWHNVKQRAKKLNLTRRKTLFSLKSKVSKLIEETPEAYYWIGFVLADGHVTDSKLEIYLAYKDRLHIKKFAEFIEFFGKLAYRKNSIGIKVTDSISVPMVAKKFNINSRKTYNPPPFYELKDEFMYALIAGFIDGDGCIRKVNNRPTSSLEIKGHKSWRLFYNGIVKFLSLKLGEKIKRAYLKNGYAYFRITRFSTLKKLKRQVLNLNLPLMKRKWSAINLNYTTRLDLSKKKDEKIIALLKQGYKNKDVAKKLCVGPSAITYRKGKIL